MVLAIAGLFVISFLILMILIALSIFVVKFSAEFAYKRKIEYIEAAKQWLIIIAFNILFTFFIMSILTLMGAR